MNIRRLPIPLATLLACLSATAQEQVTYYRDGQFVDPQDVTRILLVARPLTRSIRLLDAPTAQTAERVDHTANTSTKEEPSTLQAAGSTGKAGTASLALPLRFAFDSAEIVAAHRPQLDAIAVGIAALPLDQAVLIEGHTDATGSAEYNLRLSQRRSDAVKQYLVTVHGLLPQQLLSVGYGFQRPLESLEGANGLNRRVQFRGIEVRTAALAAIAAVR